jgi:hypothetical protein
MYDLPAMVAQICLDGALPTHDTLLYCAEEAAQNHTSMESLVLMLAAGAPLKANDTTPYYHLLDFPAMLDNPKVVSLLLAAGVEWRGKETIQEGADLDLWFVVATHPNLAKKEIELVGFECIRERLLQICIGLHELNLPTPLLIAIVEEAYPIFAKNLPYHYLWDAVISVRHFQSRRHPPVPLCSVLQKNRKSQELFLKTEAAKLRQEQKDALDVLNESGLSGVPPWCVSRLEEVLQRRQFVVYDEDPCIATAKSNLARAYLSNMDQKLASLVDIM